MFSRSTRVQPRPSASRSGASVRVPSGEFPRPATDKAVRGSALGPVAWGLLVFGVGLLGCTGQIDEAVGFSEGAAEFAVESESDSTNPSSVVPATAPDSADASEIDINVNSLLASISGQSYREGFPWTKVNEEPFQSAVADAMIDVWVSGVGALAYAAVAPEHRFRGEDVPAGTLVVREVKSPTGEVSKLTLMLKGPQGYNPALGDFWFGETDPDGVPLQDDLGAPRLGKLDGCYGCHVPRAEQGYLFGAPADNRMPFLGVDQAASTQ